MKPRRSIESVVDELVIGLGNGTIVLTEAEKAQGQARSEIGEIFLPQTDDPVGHGAREIPDESDLITDSKSPHVSRPEEQTTIAQGVFFRGEITGDQPLFIDGKVEGSINVVGNRVTIGKNGVVSASIRARDIVVLGKVRGNIEATDRVDIRAGGTLTGDVAAARISIEDGSFFKGGIDIRKQQPTTPGNEYFALSAHKGRELA